MKALAANIDDKIVVCVYALPVVCNAKASIDVLTVDTDEKISVLSFAVFWDTEVFRNAFAVDINEKIVAPVIPAV